MNKPLLAEASLQHPHPFLLTPPAPAHSSFGKARPRGTSQVGFRASVQTDILGCPYLICLPRNSSKVGMGFVYLHILAPTWGLAQSRLQGYLLGGWIGGSAIGVKTLSSRGQKFQK